MINTKQHEKQALATDQARGIILISLKLDDFGNEQILKNSRETPSRKTFRVVRK